MGRLLAVDAGLRTGLALLDGDGRLLWCRSHNLGSTARLRKAAARIMSELPLLRQVVVEGGGSLAGIWEHCAQRREVPCRVIQAQDWREDFLLPREMSSGHAAKVAACRLLGVIVRAEGWTSPTLPGHDAAEAALAGIWMAVRLGWRDMPRVREGRSVQRTKHTG